jgi:predicted GIY-YIG superfamily endonuclease
VTRLNPHRVQPSTVRVWRLYRVWRANGTLLYIGITGREPLARLIEHLYEQQWAHEIARWEVDPHEYASEVEALAAELAAIRSEKPIRNWVGNEGPHRQWLPKVGSYRHSGRRPVAAPDRWRQVFGSPWTWWLSGWLVLTLATWSALVWAADKTGQDVPGRGLALTAAVLSTVVVGRLWWVFGHHRRRGRRDGK